MVSHLNQIASEEEKVQLWRIQVPHQRDEEDRTNSVDQFEWIDDQLETNMVSHLNQIASEEETVQFWRIQVPHQRDEEGRTSFVDQFE